MVYSDKTLKLLNDIIENCKDGEKGFRESAEQAESPSLKAFFIERSQQCQAAASELQTIVVNQGGEPETDGTAAGALHRGWVAIKAALSSRDDKAVLEECERGEDRALARYDSVLKEDLPAELRLVLERQRAGAKRNHDHVRALRDEARAHS
ncbi:MAG: PA2169 family four-helix-bundle protein [Rubrivivax sp.]|nr:MAG: PA2169 family four-helix-bundle protein [Rubrivivax sp.]